MNLETPVIDDYNLAALAKALLASRFITTKPEPSSQPEIWADDRVELCETLHYYRSYKSACYETGGLVKAFMFAANAHPRDFMDASVITSRAGGGLEYDEDTREMKMKGDQKEHASIAALRNNMRQRHPVVIITSQSNPCMPSRCPRRFCVLGYFKPANIWCEKTKGHVFWRLRFEKLNYQTPSWWQPKGTVEIAKPGSLPPPVVQTCEVCLVESQQHYIGAWMCLQSGCTAFWKTKTDSGLVEPNESSLVHDPRFLKQRNPWPMENLTYPLISETAHISGHAIAGEDCARAHWSGIVCPLCGRCCPRRDWWGWKCYTPGCGYERKAPHTLIPAASIREPFEPLATTYMPSRDLLDPRVTLDISFAHNYRIHRYTIPGTEGFVTHLIANKTVVEESDGPDDMFEELQCVEIGLRRRHVGHREYLTRHFTVNYGMPYKFIAAAETSPFEDATSAIVNGRSRLNWATKLVLAQYQGQTMEDISKEWKPKEFNEVLALGYLEDQGIGYHDDGEMGLGPTIATLSLGAPGVMKLRMKPKHYYGASPSGIITQEPPILGCLAYESRRAAQQSIEDLKRLDRQTYSKRARQVAMELGLKHSAKSPKDVLEMYVGHGDIVVMHGTDLQKYYEHAVKPSGKLRFALTCRRIELESLGPKDRPSYKVEPDAGDYDGSRLPVPT
jgi:hypothetical protein